MKSNITIKDVAKKAGVSISTVSRVINDSKPVTDEVKQKVLDVIKETGYIPNPLARSLVTKKSQLIGVIIPEVSDSFANEILNGVEEIAKMYDYEILLANTYSDKEQELKSINLLRAKQVEGIVMISWKVEEEHVDYMQRCGIPACYISKTARDYDIYTVSTSNIDATYDMTKYLLDKGHEKIAFIMTSQDDTILERERLTGYEKALSERNINLNEKLIKHGTTTYEGGYKSMKEMLEEGIIPHAAFVTGDEAAIGAINAICDAGYRVPEDISVAGFNDVKIAKMYRPKLTTVHQPLYDMGAVAIRMVIKMINKEELNEKKIELPYRIEERESVIERR
ncbi:MULTISPECIES: LacI family DNA-binding transcriptional regulator [unclassified Romboutsia]|uniref:LacI family DNA-binding transcriptional regulator n=1 Tax=unclassified Romboutsia TaxID=2626894 RepID=UPI000821816B|nr:MULTISPECIES: LacI family DNA-binding transcriptional regulator [unclassified Romboutsia]SCH31339.1 Glucose-resistance amylase regulator [uncultured Clostridium sp.]